MLRSLKRAILSFRIVECFIRTHIVTSRWMWFAVPLIGRACSLLVDHKPLYFHGIGLMANSIAERAVKAAPLARPDLSEAYLRRILPT